MKSFAPRRIPIRSTFFLEDCALNASKTSYPATTYRLRLSGERKERRHASSNKSSRPKTALFFPGMTAWCRISGDVGLFAFTNNPQAKESKESEC